MPSVRIETHSFVLVHGDGFASFRWCDLCGCMMEESVVAGLVYRVPGEQRVRTEPLDCPVAMRRKDELLARSRALRAESEQAGDVPAPSCGAI